MIERNTVRNRAATDDALRFGPDDLDAANRNSVPIRAAYDTVTWDMVIDDFDRILELVTVRRR